MEQLVRDGRPLPMTAQLVAVAADVAWAPWIALGVTLPALLLPDGHLRSPRWRLVAVTTVAGPVLLMVGAGLAPGRLQQLLIDSPFGLEGAAGTAAWAVAYTGMGLHWVSMLAAGVCVVLRFSRLARGPAPANALGRRWRRGRGGRRGGRRCSRYRPRTGASGVVTPVAG